MLTENELLKKKKEIEETKTEISELKGQQKVFFKQLKEDWGCDTLEEARKAYTKLKNEVEQLDKKIEEKTEDLEETYFNQED